MTDPPPTDQQIGRVLDWLYGITGACEQCAPGSTRSTIALWIEYSHEALDQIDPDRAPYCGRLELCEKCASAMRIESEPGFTTVHAATLSWHLTRGRPFDDPAPAYRLARQQRP